MLTGSRLGVARSVGYLQRAFAYSRVATPAMISRPSQSSQGLATVSTGGSIRVALDWTPNTNHTGFYVARASGWYRRAGFSDVSLASPEGSTLTAGRQVASGEASLGVAPSETVVSFATTDKGKPRCVAVGALLQGSTSAICTLSSSGLSRPRDLAGRRYASYSGRFEDAIVRKMVENAGGDPAAVQCHPLDYHAYQDATTMATSSVVSAFLERSSPHRLFTSHGCLSLFRHLTTTT